MRATGIIRRVDDLGRVVIPKEVRRNLKIKVGEPLEIYTDNNQVVFKKYEADRDWSKLFDAIRILTKSEFAIYDDNGDCRKRTDAVMHKELADYTDEAHFIIVTDEYDNEICTIAIDPDESIEVRKQIERLVEVLTREE